MTVDDVADVIRGALGAGGPNLDAIGSVLHPDVVWTDCVGRAAVLSWLRSATDVAYEVVTVEALDDRVIAHLEVGGAGLFQALLVNDGQVVHIVDATDIDSARTVGAPAEPTPPTNRAKAEGLAAIFAVADVATAVSHYQSLGFDVERYEGDAAYAFARRDAVTIHLSQVSNVDRLANTSAAYLFVDDADSLFAEWRSAGVTGNFVEPEDTDYGIREGAHIDPDGNLIRYGSALS